MKLVKTDLYLLLIDEEAEIKEGNYYFANQWVMLCSKVDEGSKYPYLNQYGNYDSIHWKGIIIAYYPLTKEAKELDLPLLPKPFDITLEIKTAFKETFPIFEEKNSILEEGFEYGYKAAQSKQSFSLEDMKKAWEFGVLYTKGSIGQSQNYTFDKLIESLSTQQLPKGFILGEGGTIEEQIKNGCYEY